MEDLLQSQIKESCYLAVPDGLKELMTDISREVLRAQPLNVYNFVTNYLSVLLVTRENLTIAAKICDKTCHAPCQRALEDKLRDIGLNDEEVNTARTIIMEHLQGAVKESNLLLKLMRNINLDETMLPAVQGAIRLAFLQQYAHHNHFIEPRPDYEDEVTQAASHTIRLYENATSSNEACNQMAKKIQEPDKTKSSQNNIRNSVTTESSTSLAGSYIKLPKYIPYSAHDIHAYNFEEVFEKIHSTIDFTEDVIKRTEKNQLHDETTKEQKRRISFEALIIEDDVLDADDASEETIEELIHVKGDNGIGSDTSGVNDEMYETDVNEMKIGFNGNEITENSDEHSDVF